MKAAENLKSGVLCVLFLITLWMPGLCAQYAEIVFDNLYTLVFRKNQMRRFQECMCHDAVSACILDYYTDRVLGEYFYEAGGTFEETQSSDVYGNITFLCSPGDFIRSNELVCVRLNDSFERCTRQENCLITHVDYFLNACDSKCINVAWSGYSVSFRNFTIHNLMFNDGTCWDPPTQTDSIVSTSTEPTQTSTATNQTRFNPNSSDDENITTVTAIAAVGWGLFLVMIAIFMYFFLCRNHNRLRKKETQSTMQMSENNENTNAVNTFNLQPPLSSPNISTAAATDGYEAPRTDAYDIPRIDAYDIPLTDSHDTPHTNAYDHVSPNNDEVNVYTVMEDTKPDDTQAVGQDVDATGLSGHSRQAADSRMKDNGQRTYVNII
ncbi:hypothetical protein PoB_002705200 [Plakobranchus ocellatus]|uniref:Uncharacterized protein n=1 Tax=Plakobranchus ocellatus TaxID=259542 RepID=A0AAV3ZZU3_9GAST|nr:hypothetical protein PoB_002705200 [Plakobranchus ocellatus]